MRRTSEIEETAPVEPEHVHLNNHHRDTLEKIFRHPTSHNIEWLDVLSLLEVVGIVNEGHDGKYVVILGSETETFERPKQKDVAIQVVIDLRRMLRGAGYGGDGD
jgi:hypothetical protein